MDSKNGRKRQYEKEKLFKVKKKQHQNPELRINNLVKLKSRVNYKIFYIYTCIGILVEDIFA